jgi:hypothetical protein
MKSSAPLLFTLKQNACNSSMVEISAVRRQNLEALIAEAGTLERVAEAAGSSSVYLSQVRRQAVDRKSGRRREMGTPMARRLEAAYGKPSGWMDTAHAYPAELITSRIAAQEPAPRADLPAPLPVFNAPRVPWGQSMRADLPVVFSVVVPDDSMAPRVRLGDVIRLDRSQEARPGDGVLIVDRDGRWYFRLYSVRRPGDWEAHPINPAYQPLHGTNDGLTVIAVLTGIEQQRWG